MNFADRLKNNKDESSKYDKLDEEVFTFTELDEAVAKINAGLVLAPSSMPVKDRIEINQILAIYVELIKTILKGER